MGWCREKEEGRKECAEGLWKTQRQRGNEQSETVVLKGNSAEKWRAGWRYHGCAAHGWSCEEQRLPFARGWSFLLRIGDGSRKWAAPERL
jgi:hypothetical protein